MSEGTAAEWLIFKRLLESDAVKRLAPGGVHPWPAPEQIMQTLITVRLLPGADDMTNFASSRVKADLPYEVVAVADTGSRGYGPLVKAQNAIDAALQGQGAEEAGTVTEFGVQPHILIERASEVREPELRLGGGIRRRLGGVYRVQVFPDAVD